MDVLIYNSRIYAGSKMENIRVDRVRSFIYLFNSQKK